LDFISISSYYDVKIGSLTSVPGEICSWLLVVAVASPGWVRLRIARATLSDADIVIKLALRFVGAQSSGGADG